MAQSAHTPLVPHAVSAVPATQTPPEAALQQPLLHGAVEEQAVPHVPLLVSQASPGTQSDALLQPQVPFARQASPDATPMHEAHVAPDAPQAVCVVPETHVPALQQPPLHVWVDEHAVVHPHGSPCRTLGPWGTRGGRVARVHVHIRHAGVRSARVRRSGVPVSPPSAGPVS